MKSYRYYTRLLFIACLTEFFISHHALGQLSDLSANVDKQNILIGEQLHYNVSISIPDNAYRLSWFSVPDSFGTFVVVSSGKIDSGLANGQQHFSQQLTLTSFDSGSRVIPPLEFQIDPLANDSTYHFFTDSFRVNVGFSPMDSVKTFHDIKNIIEVEKKWPWWMWPLIGLLAILIILAIIFRKKLFGKKEKPAAIIDAKLTPFEEAMKNLDNLEKQNLLQDKQSKEFHLQLSGVFKRYYTRITNVNKQQLTSDEILMELDQSALGKNEVTKFANCLRMGNAVKFAKFIPSQTESEQCLEETRDMIRKMNKVMNKPENAV